MLRLQQVTFMALHNFLGLSYELIASVSSQTRYKLVTFKQRKIIMTVKVFGHLILISVDFSILFLSFLLRFTIDREDIIIKHETQCMTTF